jgi:hypothetical protein
MISETHKSCLVFLIGVMIMTCMPARTDAVVVGAENVNKDMDGSPQIQRMTSRSDNDGDFTNSIGPALIRSSAVITSAGEALVAQVSGSTASKKPDAKEAAKAKANAAAKEAAAKGLMDGTNDAASYLPVEHTGRACKKESLELLSHQRAIATFTGCKKRKTSARMGKKKWGCDFKITKDLSFEKENGVNSEYGDEKKAKGSTMRFTDRPSEIAAKVLKMVGGTVSPSAVLKMVGRKVKGGATVRLEWKHNYVTCDASKFPERVITKLEEEK